VLARGKLSKEPPAIRTARDLGKASYVTSVAGILVAAVVVVILLIVVSQQFLKFSCIEFLFIRSEVHARYHFEYVFATDIWVFSLRSPTMLFVLE